MLFTDCAASSYSNLFQHNSYFILTDIANITNNNGNVMLSRKYWLLKAGTILLLVGTHIKYEKCLD